MKLIHTSDWHIGRVLYNKKRYEEFERFLDWLSNFIKKEHVDALLIAGDVFDSSTPSNRAQELYYRFLGQVAFSGCRHVVIIAGNHDSPSLLDAPKNLLQVLNIHVVGSLSESPENDVLVLRNRDDNNAPELIVCAVPYLRDRDIRKAEAGESIDDKGNKLIEGIRDHYFKVCNVAEQLRAVQNSAVSIVAMGHLFTAGGQTIDGDGVRELYIGSLARVGVNIFPSCIDYLALGHLHIPQRVSGSETKRYSGSPIPMSFGEAEQQKYILEVNFSGDKPTIQEIPVPCFQQLLRIRGDLAAIIQKLEQLRKSDRSIWLEIIYEGHEIIADLQERLQSIIEGTKLELFPIRIRRNFEQAMHQKTIEETLDDLEPEDVFLRCLDVNDVPDEQRSELINSFHEIITTMREEDVQAE